MPQDKEMGRCHKHRKLQEYITAGDTMVDRYGDDMDFQEKYGAEMKKIMSPPMPSNDDNKNIAGDDMAGHNTNKVDVKAPSQLKEEGVAKKLDKSSWEYWELHAPTKEIVWDGKNYVPNNTKLKKEATSNDVTVKSEKSK